MRRFGAQRSTQRQLGHPTRLEQEPGLGGKCIDTLDDNLSYINRRSGENTPPHPRDSESEANHTRLGNQFGKLHRVNERGVQRL
jgi:hypothetical protein